MAPAKSVEAGLAVRRMRHWGPRRYPVALTAFGAIRGYDLVHIHAIDFFVDYLSLLRLLHRVPLVVSTHGGFFHTQWATTLQTGVLQDRYPQVAGRGGSGGLREPARSRNVLRIVPPQRIRVIENGADIDRFRGLKKDIEPGLVLGISRLAEHKRVHKVLEAMASLKHRYPRMRLEWAGADFAGLRAELERRVVELGLGGRVRFHGATSREELISIARAGALVRIGGKLRGLWAVDDRGHERRNRGHGHRRGSASRRGGRRGQRPADGSGCDRACGAHGARSVDVRRKTGADR